MTPLPPSLLPLIVRKPMYTGDRLPEAEMMAISLPDVPEEDKRDPPLGWPISQEVGCPAGVPRNTPPSSTSGAKKASPGDPLRNLTNYRSAGWRKDLNHILRGFYLYNYPSRKDEDWDKLKTKFFDHLGQ